MTLRLTGLLRRSGDECGATRALAWKVCCTMLLLTMAGAAARAQQAPSPFNLDEAKVPPYTLPDPLTLENGEKVTTAAMWTEKRRPELLRLFAENVYGFTPKERAKIRATHIEVDEHALGGTAVRRQVTLEVSRNGLTREMHLLIYTPAHASGAVPIFLGLNFTGNQTVSTDAGIDLNPTWVHPPNAWLTVSTPLRRAVPDVSERGQAASQWQVDKIIAHGYGLATMYDGDIEPDNAAGLAEGIRPLFYRKGQTAPDADQWGTIGAWAWGLSRAADYLQHVPGVDGSRIILFGHSRLGKTALWASAQDTRFAMVIANESGKGGAALAKRNFGQTVLDLNTHYPHWFCENYRKYNDNEAALPVDNNELIALSAPRPLYIGTADGDIGGDVKGQFLAEIDAEPVYALFGKTGLGATVVPPVEHPIQHDLGFHLRKGKHGVTEYDWDQYIAFADLHFGKRVPGQ
jgi:hypothetical protein